MSQSTFDTVPISPLSADKRYPCASMKAFKGTKKEEVVVLRHLLPKDASNPFKGPLNKKNRDYAQRKGFKDAVYEDVIQLLDTYVSIQDLLNAVFRAQVVDTNLGMRRDSKH